MALGSRTDLLNINRPKKLIDRPGNKFRDRLQKKLTPKHWGWS